MSTGRKQGLATVYRPSDYVDGSIREAVKCPCGEYMAFTIDALGRVSERCPRCRGLAPPVPLRPGEQRGLQTVPEHIISLPERVLLPKVAEGQLRCQRCARGVEGDVRFCDDCRQKGGRKGGFQVSDATREKIRVAQRARQQRLREERQ